MLSSRDVKTFRFTFWREHEPGHRDESCVRFAMMGHYETFAIGSNSNWREALACTYDRPIAKRIRDNSQGECNA